MKNFWLLQLLEISSYFHQSTVLWAGQTGHALLFITDWTPGCSRRGRWKIPKTPVHLQRARVQSPTVKIHTPSLKPLPLALRQCTCNRHGHFIALSLMLQVLAPQSIHLSFFKNETVPSDFKLIFLCNFQTGFVKQTSKFVMTNFTHLNSAIFYTSGII